MGIENYLSIDELNERIINDRNSPHISDNRFPIRFIFLNSFKELKELTSLLSSSSNKVIELGSFLPNENAWITPDEIITFTEKLSNDSVIVPVSEFLRFLDINSFYNLLKSLAEIEKENIRIYIPLVGLWERFEREFWDNFYRKKEWAPIWKLDTSPKKMHIYQTNFDIDHQNMDLNGLELVSSTEDWFNLWKKDYIEDIISLSKPLSFYYKNSLPDQTFDLEMISTQKIYIQKIFRTDILIEFKKNEVNFWNKLIMELSRYKEKGITLKKIFSKHFNVRDIDKLPINEYLNLYLKNENNHYEKWLIKNFFNSLATFKLSYLNHCFGKLDNLGNKNLAEKLWIEIFSLDFKDSVNFFNERKKLLKILEKYQFSINEENLYKNIEKIRDYPFKKQSNYLTNITFTERKYILETIKKEDINSIISSLKDLYPEIYYYLDWDLIVPDNIQQNWIIDYLKEYNISKVKNIKTNRLETLINTKNKNMSSFLEWFYPISTSKIEGDTYYIWVDGLGAEWFPLIVHLIEIYSKGKEKSLKKKMITRINLPTITKCNKYKFDKIDDLDYYVHKQKSYKHPNTLIEEIEIIKEIIKEILDIPREKITILSDHGLSFLCQKEFGNIKKHKFENAKHSGRYMWINNENYKEDDDYLIWKIDDGECQDKKAIVALKHVSLNNTPYKEVHGGATPEEILVPYISIETKKEYIKEEKICYKVEPKEFDIQISQSSIQFKISPSPSHIPQACSNEQSLKLSFKNDIYSLDLNDFKVGQHLIIIEIGDNQFELKVNIKGGFKERDLI